MPSPRLAAVEPPAAAVRTGAGTQALKIQQIDVAYRTQRPGDFPQESLPEVAFLGRSNVGKSSVINSLVNRKKLAPISQTPGKTRTINWYRITGSGPAFFLVDLPGYGYAKVSKVEREQVWARLINTYLESRRPLVKAVQLLDIRRDGPTKLDRQMIRWLEEVGVPHVFVLTKCDKLKRGRRLRAVQEFSDVLGTEEGSDPIPYSAVTGEGKRELWAVIDRSLARAA